MVLSTGRSTCLTYRGISPIKEWNFISYLQFHLPLTSYHSVPVLTLTCDQFPVGVVIICLQSASQFRKHNHVLNVRLP